MQDKMQDAKDEGEAAQGGKQSKVVLQPQLCGSKMPDQNTCQPCTRAANLKQNAPKSNMTSAHPVVLKEANQIELDSPKSLEIWKRTRARPRVAFQPSQIAYRSRGLGAQDVFPVGDISDLPIFLLITRSYRYVFHLLHDSCAECHLVMAFCMNSKSKPSSL
jgi:hypothetical protein